MRTLIGTDQITARVAELGGAIREVYGDEPVIAVCVLKGSFVFTADLVRAIGGTVHVEFLGVSSYHGTTSTGAVQITQDLRAEVEGKHVLVVEDIVDTGLTLHYLLELLRVRRPKTLRVACLLDKPSRRKTHVPVDWVGFSIPDEFVVGYGLDMDEQFRNLPFIGVYEGP